MSPKLKKGLKLGGFIAAFFVYFSLSILVYYTKNDPSSVDIWFRDTAYQIRGEKYGFWFWFFRIFTEFGDFIVIGIIFVVFGLYTKFDFRFFVGLFGLLLAILTNVAVKNMYQRERPFEEMRWMVEETSSFPSGHSTASAFLYTYLAYTFYHLDIKKISKILWFGCLQALIVIVMVSRLILGVHYFSDVLAGYASGIMVACFAMLVYHFCEKNNILTEGFFAFMKKADKE